MVGTVDHPYAVFYSQRVQKIRVSRGICRSFLIWLFFGGLNFHFKLINPAGSGCSSIVTFSPQFPGGTPVFPKIIFLKLLIEL